MSFPQHHPFLFVVYTGVHPPRSAHVEASKSQRPPLLSTLFSETGSLNESETVSERLVASETPGSVYLPALRLQMCTAMPSFY